MTTFIAWAAIFAVVSSIGLFIFFEMYDAWLGKHDMEVNLPAPLKVLPEVDQ